MISLITFLVKIKAFDAQTFTFIYLSNCRRNYCAIHHSLLKLITYCVIKFEHKKSFSSSYSICGMWMIEDDLITFIMR